MFVPCNLETRDINGEWVTLTDDAYAAYYSLNSTVVEIVMNLACFGANTICNDLPKDDDRRTKITDYNGTPCIVQWRLTPKFIVMTVLFNPRTELRELDLETLNGMELDYDVTETNFTQYAEAFCTTEYGDQCNYPYAVSGSGGTLPALARIAACPTEISYKKIDYQFSAAN